MSSTRATPGRVERARAKAAKRSRRRPLSVEAIVDVALRIVDAESTEAVSMRRVAAEFDTGPASLYAHVRNRDQLLELVLDRVLGSIPVPEATDWKGVVRGWAESTRAAYVAHNDVAILSFAVVPDSDPMLEVSEKVLGAMISAGVPAQVAAWALDTISLYVGADAYEGWLYAQRFRNGGAAVDYFTAVRDRFAALSTTRFPFLTAHIGALMNGDDNVRFGFGLDMLIAGIEAQIPRSGSPSAASPQGVDRG